MADYHYYIVEHCWLVRVNAQNMVEAERFAEDGQWVPFHDLYDITMNGRQITAEKATEWIRESEDSIMKYKILEERKKRRALGQK